VPKQSAHLTQVRNGHISTRVEQNIWKQTGITGKTLEAQLLECCDGDLRKDLTRLAGGSVANKEEDTVLATIQKLAVRRENVMVARVALYDMQQQCQVR